MTVSIRAILLSGTATLKGADVAPGLGKGVAPGLGKGVADGLGKGVAAGLGSGVGVGLGAAVCGLGWAMTEIDIIAISISAAISKRFLFIAFPPGKCSRILSSAYTDRVEKKKRPLSGRQGEPRLSGPRITI
jgi:hypothetical protein